MNNEIKQGDKVRVSRDIPQFFRRYNSYRIFEVEHQVVDIEDGIALLDSIPSKYVTAIPTKYLVKVDAEAKEAKFKVGDKVRIKGCGYEPNLHKGDIGEILDTNDKGQCFVLFKKSQAWIYTDCLELYTEPTVPTIKAGDRVRNIESGLIGVVDKIVYGNIAWVNGVDGKRYHWKSDGLELVSPTEQAEKKPYEGISEETANEISDMLEAYAKTLSGIADSFDWQRYEADLAKEVALKVANKFNDPKEAAEYAVSVANVVVEGLKWK